ncbi:hypothetical protein KP509_24G025000 [Ceratopteris richardii]|uniref:tRNA-intron lyase n=1 Tax=Ceratopteris richardii TaxID=49495 RepID=A0A8T2RVW7_CERRI|nr:hypothetical protein KP509_24G025000 [Ceratopteris richardii]
MEPRWKYLKAKQFALENPISDVYRQMQCMPYLKSFFTPTAVVLEANSLQSELLNSCCIGRPFLIGPQASVSSNQSEEVLLYELGFEEAFFLSYELKCLQVWQKSNQEEILLNNDSMWQLMRLHKHGFSYFYLAYSHLRKKNWLVRTGLQYGVHFVAYRHHPSHVHAEYSVVVIPEWEREMQMNSWSHMQGIIRLCGNVAKTLLLLHIARTESDDQHPQCLESYSVKEMEVKRWLPEKHRMQNCETAIKS